MFVLKSSFVFFIDTNVIVLSSKGKVKAVTFVSKAGLPLSGSSLTDHSCFQ